MVSPTIDVINQSAVVADANVQAAIPAFQSQISRDFAPFWGRDAAVNFVGKAPLHAGCWQLVILDDSDQAGALGYHDLTATGLPLSKVFAKTDKQYGLSWTVTASHELLEMLGDPYIQLCALEQTSAKKGRLFAYEACDAVEADALGYTIGGVHLSDFVTPAWFCANDPGPYDFCKHLTKPFQLLKGGYIGYMDLSSAHGWQQQTDESEPRRNQSMHYGSRTERRQRGVESWKRSTVCG